MSRKIKPSDVLEGESLDTFVYYLLAERSGKEASDKFFPFIFFMLLIGLFLGFMAGTSPVELGVAASTFGTVNIIARVMFWFFAAALVLALVLSIYYSVKKDEFKRKINEMLKAKNVKLKELMDL